MRTKYWRPIFLCSWFLVAGTQALWAQDNPAGQYFYQRGGSGGPGGPPPQAGMDSVGYPPGGNPWPEISPYGPPVNQFYTNNGFWFDRILSGQAKYYSTMEGLITRTGAPPHALIGAEGVNNFLPFDLVQNPGGGTVITVLVGGHANGAFLELPIIVNNDSPERIFLNSTGTGTLQQNGTIPVFPEMNAGVIRQKIGSGGTRGTWGWWNPDSSGLQVQGFWQDKATSDYSEGDRRLILDNTYNNNVYTRTHPYFGLPLPGADRDGDGLPGTVVPYDLFVQFDYSSSVFGGSLDWFFSPLYERDHFKIRPMAGARVMKINEAFSFSGGDSGLGYELTPGILTFVGSNSGNTTNGNSTQSTPGVNNLFISTLDPEFAIPNPIYSYLRSRTQGTFAGPEVGLRFDLGGEHFKVWTQSKFGLLANQTTRSVSGYNIGDHFTVVTPLSLNLSNLPPDPLTNGIPANPLRAAGALGSTFTRTDHNYTVSPMFEQGIFMQAPLLGYIPIINRLSIFENAVVQSGYTVTVLGNVYRPTSDINWAQYPDYPTLNGNTAKFYTSNWSVGIQWNY